MIEFKYILGGDLELTVQARFIEDEPENDFVGGPELTSIKLPDGKDFEIDEIYIRSRGGRFESLESLMEIESSEQARVQYEELN